MVDFWTDEAIRLRTQFPKEFAYFVVEHIDEILGGDPDEWIEKIVAFLRVFEENKALELTGNWRLPEEKR